MKALEPIYVFLWRFVTLPGRRLRVLLSAYACEPGRGSEPGGGWNVAYEMAAYHEVWVLTRAKNRPSIEVALKRAPALGVCFVYYDLPPWARWWKRGEPARQFYYYFWQIGAFFVARRLHRRICFDLVHHVTLVKYWAPSFLTLLSIPFIWGPVGGGESAPKAFWRHFRLRAIWYELWRDIGRWLGERDPFVRLTARQSALALATTEETAERLRKVGARNIRLLPVPIGLRMVEIGDLARPSLPDGIRLRFISIGRLLHWKGFHIGLRAFAQANLDGAEYWIVGDGPERKSLEASARRLGIADRVRFWGWLPRGETLHKLEEAHVLVHPSLHDAGGDVCIEAMATGRPVICLDLGGPATKVNEQVGLKVRAHNPEEAIRDLAHAMHRLVHDPGLRQMMGTAGRQRAMEVFCWESKGKLLDTMYWDVIESS